MKILQIAPAWINTPPNGYGGTEWVIANLAKGLTNQKQKVTVFATKNSKVDCDLKYFFENGFLEKNIPWTAALPPLLHYHQAFKLASGYDIVHAHMSSITDISLLPFLADLTDKGIPNIVTIHYYQPFDIYSNMDEYYFKTYGSKIIALTISKSMQRFAYQNFMKAGVAYNSLDTSTIKFNSKSGKYLTWLGKIKKEKGVHEAIQIAKKLGEQFIFAGVIEKTNPPEAYQYFKNKVEPLIDGKQIIFLGEADLKMKSKLLSGAKAFLNPIDWEEPFGMVMVESMAAGTPVISYSRGAAPELIIDGKTGFLVSDKAGMIKALGKIDQIDREFCRQHVEEKFSVEAAAKSHIEIYKQVISKFDKSNKSKKPVRYFFTKFGSIIKSRQNL